MTYVALLRGVNVGGKNRVPMTELVSVLLTTGCRAVRTYIQSGNILFRADETPEQALAAQISTAIQANFGLTIPVVLRTASEMRALIKRNRFLSEGVADEDYLHVTFLSGPPAEVLLDQANEQRFAPDTFHVHGRELYLWAPNGLGRSKLPAALERRLKAMKVTATTRNWRTTVQLAKMAAELDGS